MPKSKVGGEGVLNEIGVVVVTYRPVGDFESRLKRMRAQGGALVIVDNASDTIDRSRLEGVAREEGWVFIGNDENVGLAAALNLGVCEAFAQGFEWVLLFDQDSEPAEDLSEQLLATWRGQPRPESVAVVGANFSDAATGRAHRFLRQHPRSRWFFAKTPVAAEDRAVTMVITSGSLIYKPAFATAGPFEESLFIDFVDTDFCLRCRAAGWEVIASAAARMQHALGNRSQRRWLGVIIEPTNHSPLRHYYIARNRVPMMKRHAKRWPHWFFFECAAAVLWFVRVIAVEEKKRQKLTAMLLGTWDGFRGVTGKCSARRARQLES